MRILFLSSELWNDNVSGNNILTNWFAGMDAEFAQIYCSPGQPLNQVCQKYFQLTDMMMFKSFFGGRPAGHEVECVEAAEGLGQAEAEPKKLYSSLKKISGPFLRFVRECIWYWGRYDIDALEKFVDDFQPDVVFSERLASMKMLRLERQIMKITNAPFFIYAGDDEYTLQEVSFSPFFWINRFIDRSMLKKNVKKYYLYYIHSDEQKALYEREFGVRAKQIYKCGDFEADYKPAEKEVHYPIRLIYAGRFYCNRWKVLGEIAEALREINSDGVKIVLNIYTADAPTKKQNVLLNDGVSSIIHDVVSPAELLQIYKDSDIALHVESQDLKNSLTTKFSFSTKIIDCIFSECALMAYCGERQYGWKYLYYNDAAICVSSNAEMKAKLQEIVENPSIINEYREKAYRCGVENHRRENVQRMLMEDFREGIQNNHSIV